jgi:rubrerythrin
MPFQQVVEVLDRIRSFHSQLRSFYERSSAMHRDERLSLLLAQMGRHEQQLEACLAEFERDLPGRTGKTWIQYVADTQVQGTIDHTEFQADPDAHEVIHRSLEVDRALIRCYRALATSLLPPSVRELFQHLLDMEETKSRGYCICVAELFEQSGTEHGPPPAA